jgi:hypothetical protein
MQDCFSCVFDLPNRVKTSFTPVRNEAGSYAARQYTGPTLHPVGSGLALSSSQLRCPQLCDMGRVECGDLPCLWGAWGRLMAQLGSALVLGRFKGGMVVAKARGKRLGRPATPPHLVAHIEELGRTTRLSIRHIQEVLAGHVSRSVVDLIVKRIRHP